MIALIIQKRINPTPANGCLTIETDTMKAVAIKSTKMIIHGTLNITGLRTSSVDLGRSRRERSPKIVRNATENSAIPIQHTFSMSNISLFYKRVRLSYR